VTFLREHEGSAASMRSGASIGPAAATKFPREWRARGEQDGIFAGRAAFALFAATLGFDRRAFLYELAATPISNVFIVTGSRPRIAFTNRGIRFPGLSVTTIRAFGTAGLGRTASSMAWCAETTLGGLYFRH
jgi:hypothetical protein